MESDAGSFFRKPFRQGFQWYKYSLRKVNVAALDFVPPCMGAALAIGRAPQGCQMQDALLLEAGTGGTGWDRDLKTYRCQCQPQMVEPSPYREAVIPNPFSMEKPLKPCFTSRGTPTYENIYRSKHVDGREYNSITAKILLRNFICKE